MDRAVGEEGDNGKSVYLKVMRRLLGRGYCLTSSSTTSATPTGGSARRSSEQMVAEIKRNVARASGPNWTVAELVTVVQELKHIFNGSREEAMHFVRRACERGWPHYQMTACMEIR